MENNKLKCLIFFSLEVAFLIQIFFPNRLKEKIRRIRRGGGGLGWGVCVWKICALLNTPPPPKKAIVLKNAMAKFCFSDLNNNYSTVGKIKFK